jgi:hypothetical protein
MAQRRPRPTKRFRIGPVLCACRYPTARGLAFLVRGADECYAPLQALP